MNRSLNPLIAAGLVVDFGFGGFFDGIVLHQLLQWHHLVSSIYPADTLEGLEINTLWDGVFHLSTYAISVVGLALFWRALRRPGVPHSPRALIGAVAMGFGAFHLFDSVVNHWILQIHHIRMGPDALLYDLAFFAIGLVLLGIGSLLVRRSSGQAVS